MSNNHNNAFINLNGVPYLLSEYVDQNTFQTIDRALVKNEINIDSSDPGRAIVDISIDNIGRRSDGTLNVLGNATKQNSLIDMIKENIYRIEHHLPVLKRGLMLRIHYQLENNRTGKVLRSLQEDIRIADRNYFIDINANNINDNAIIVNFTDSIVSTINQFTHGTDIMQLRITSIQLGYECVRPNKMRPQIGHSIYNTPPEMYADDGLNNEQEMYYYHKSLQPKQYLGDPYYNQNIIPNQWYDFNRFYHFDESGADIIIHDQEINDRNNRIMHILCGDIVVNRTFLVQPGQRIIFKFSVWKNDLCIFNNTTRVAEALRVNTTPYWPPVPPQPQPQPQPAPTPYPQPVYPPYPGSFEFKYIIDLLESMKGMDYRQNGVINKIDESLKEVTKVIKELHEEAQLPDIPDSDLPIKPDYPYPPAPGPRPPKPDKTIIMILKMIKDLQEQVDKLIQDEDDAKPITDEQIQEILDALEKDYQDDGEYNGSTDYPFKSSGLNESEIDEEISKILGSIEE